MNQQIKETRELKRAITTEVVTSALDIDFRKFYKLYLIDTTTEQCKGLSVAAAIICNAAEYMQNNSISTKKSWFFELLAEIVDMMGVKYIPLHPRRLREKIVKKLEGESIENIIFLPRAGNQNRRIEGGQELEAWLYYLRSAPQNFTNALIIRKIKMQCQLLGRLVPSDSWFNERLAEKEVQFLTADGRFGNKGRLGNKYRGYNMLENALFAGDAWQMDGTRVNMIDHKSEGGKQAFLYIVAVRDVHSGACLGVCFSTTEDRWMYINALRMAALKVGYLPCQLVHDKFPGHNTDEWQNITERLLRNGVKVTVSTAATGKAQQERWFGTLQTCFMAQSNYYYGEGIQSRRLYAHRTGDFVKEQRRIAKAEGWDFSRSCDEALRVLEAYNNTPLSHYSRKRKNVTESPEQLHDMSEKPNVIKSALHKVVTLQCFGNSKILQIRGGGRLVTEIYGTEHIFEISEFHIISTMKAVRIAYDLEDLSQVEMFDVATDKWLGTAKATERIQLFGANPEYDKLGQSKKRLATLEQSRREAMSSKIQNADEGHLALLMNGQVDKGIAEQAETDFFLHTYDEKAARRELPSGEGLENRGLNGQLSDENDDDNFNVDVRAMY